MTLIEAMEAHERHIAGLQHLTSLKAPEESIAMCLALIDDDVRAIIAAARAEGVREGAVERGDWQLPAKAN